MGELNWLIFGTGAIGTYIGGCLVLRGERVVFVDQPAVVEELKQSGLRLSLIDGEHQVTSPLAYSSISEALDQGPFDLAVFALKSYDTQNALINLSRYQDQLPVFLCLQNGVENEALLSGMLGEGRVIPGTVTSAIGKRATGDVVLERMRGMGIADNHPLSARAAAVMNKCELNAKLFSNAASMKWSKMLTNLLVNAIPAILNLTPREVLGNLALYRLEMLQLREALKVMDALDIPVVDLPKVPIKLLALAAQRLPIRLSQPLVRRFAGRGRGQKMPSLHIDLLAGHGKSEVDYLNGAVVRFGEKTGVPTPVNQRLNETLLALISGKIPLDSYRKDPQRLIEDL